MRVDLRHQEHHVSRRVRAARASSGPERGSGTHRRVGPMVMRLNVCKVACVLESWDRPVQLAHPAVDVRVPAADGADVTLEVADIDGVEPDLRDHRA